MVTAVEEASRRNGLKGFIPDEALDRAAADRLWEQRLRRSSASLSAATITRFHVSCDLNGVHYRQRAHRRPD